jgi:hypothetical protein
MHQPNPSTDPQLIQADTDGMIDRREEHHYGYEASQRSDAGHPVNTDPPTGPVRHKQQLSTVMCGTCAPAYVIHAAEWYPFTARDGETVSCTTCGAELGGRIDPLGDATHCPCGGYWQTFENGTFCKDCDRRKVTAKYLAEQAALASQDEADSGTEQATRHALQFARFQNLSSDRARAEWGISNYDNHSSMGEFAIALLRPVDRLGVQLRVFTDATAALRAFLTSDAMDPLATCCTPEEVENTLQAAGLRDAGQQPPLGTRVKRLIQPAGDLGTVVGWHHELQLPEIEWDSQRGLPAEACEPHEFTTDLNEQIDRWR